MVKHVVGLIAALSWVKAVQRIKIGGNAWADAPFVTVAQGDDLLEAEQTRPYTTRRLELLVTVVIRETDEADVRPSDEILNGYGGEIEQALMADLSVGETAQEIKPPDWLEIEVESKEPHIGVSLRFAIVYRHLRNDPFSKG